MSKAYKGYKLMKAIANGEIKEGSRFNTYRGIVYFDGINLREDNKEGHYFLEGIDDLEFSKLNFELIEDETIDIDNIEPFTFLYSLCSDSSETLNEKIRKIVEKQNELIQAVKQLNKEIKNFKELSKTK